MSMNLSRRTFLRTATAGTVGLAALDPALPEAFGEAIAPIRSASFSTEPSRRGIRFRATNGLTLELVISENRLLGIGAIALNGKSLRSDAENIWPEIATPYGEEVAYLEFLGVAEHSGALIVSTRPHFRIGHRMEWTEQAPQALINMGGWSQAPQAEDEARLEWIILPVDETHDGISYSGFSYGFRYSDPRHPIYQIEDKATWELGGNAAGNGFIMRGANAPHIRFADPTPMYSGWDFAESPNPHIFQHKPLYTQMQGFTFQYDAEHLLLTVHERPSHVRSVYFRLPGDPRIIHFNQMCFDFATKHTTPPRKILMGERKSGDDTELANHYLRVRDGFQANHRRYYGLKYDKTRPVSHVEASGLAQLDKFPAVFRRLQEWGIHRAFIMPIWRSPDTDINPLFANEKDRFGVFGNLCCPLELEIAECYGGWDGFERLMKSAADASVEPYTWHASHFSSLTPLLTTIPDLFCRDQSGQFNRNNYGHVLMAVNQRSPKYQAYLMDCYRKARRLGLRGIFHDSHFNLATDTINYLHGDYGSESHPANPNGFAYPGDARSADQIWSMHDVSLGLQSRLQNEIGLFYNVESEGALGSSQTSPDYDFLRGNEYIYSNMDSAIDLRDLKRFGDDPVMVYFRGLSVRLTYQVGIDPNRFPDPASIANWWNAATMAPLNVAFARVEHAMEEMWLLADDRGVLWKSGREEVLFSYKEFDFTLEAETQVLEAVTGKSYRQDKSLRVNGLGIYLLVR